MGVAAWVRAPRLALACAISGARGASAGVTGCRVTRSRGLAADAIPTSSTLHLGNPARLSGRAATGSEDTQDALAGCESRHAPQCSSHHRPLRERAGTDSEHSVQKNGPLDSRRISGVFALAVTRSSLTALALSLTFALGIGLYTGERPGGGPSLRARFGSEASATLALAKVALERYVAKRPQRSTR